MASTFASSSRSPGQLLPESNPSSDQKGLTTTPTSYPKSIESPNLNVDLITEQEEGGEAATGGAGGSDDKPESPVKTKTRVSLLTRSRASPIHTRSGLSENYEKPITGREEWWRKTIKETPGPTAYDAPSLLADLKKRPNTYRFKSDGRRLDPHPQIGRGAYLMPGAYNHRDMVEKLERSLTTYSFKNTGREQRDAMNFGKKDKDINISPDAYAIEKYLTLSCAKQGSKHWNFRSQSQRFPTVQFVPKIGPPPGNYEHVIPDAAHVCSSSFKSKTPRFVTSHTKTPGPGAYEKVFQSPMPKTVLNMARNHGVFFSSAFQV